MLFWKKESRKKSSPLVGLFRIIISLFMMSLLGIGLFLSFKSFSGVDPLTFSPQSLANNFFASQSVYDFVISLLTVSPSESINKAKNVISNDNKDPSTGNGSSQPQSQVKFRFAIIADSHIDTQNLAKALKTAKSDGAKFIVGIGDFSDVGTVDELRSTKLQLDTVGLPYYVTPGDHDLWDSRDKKKEASANFEEVFGTPYQSFAYSNVRLILYYDTDNYLGLDDLQLNWLQEELTRVSQDENATLIFAVGGTPLYHPSSDRVMGKVEPKLKNQAEHLISLFKKYGVSEVFAGDIHMFSRYEEPKQSLQMTTVGSVSSVRNPQAPRFVMVDVYEDDSYNVKDVELK